MPSKKSRCSTSIETILNAIQQDTRIKAVIIASRGPIYLNSKGFGPVEAGYNYPPISERASINGATETARSRCSARGSTPRSSDCINTAFALPTCCKSPSSAFRHVTVCVAPLTLTRGESGCTVAFAVYRERMHPYGP
jgi:hypothetical protein